MSELSTISINEIIGDRIACFRRQAKITQRTLSRDSGLSPSFISHVETGRCGLSAESAARIARSLDMPIEYMLAPLMTFERWW